MIDYRCADCSKLQFRAASAVPVMIESKCVRCGALGQPVTRIQQPMHRSYECTRCHRTQHCERPVQTKTHCLVCGTPTLIITAETGRINTEGIGIPPSATERLVLVPAWRETN